MAITAKGHKMLAAFHGLDPEKNTDDDVAESIKNAVKPEDVKALKNRATTAEAALAEERVKGDLDKYAKRIGKDDKIIAHWKQALLTNRSATIEILEALPEPDKGGKPAPLHNRSSAASPKPLDTDTTSEAKANAQAGKIANRAADLRKGGMTHRLAFNQAQREFAE